MGKFRLLILAKILLILVFFSYQTIVSAAGNLIGYWKFDETTTGETVADSSGNANHGSPKNSPVPSTDVPEGLSFSDPRSLSFNGTNQYVQISDSDVFTLVDGTFSTWIKFNSIPGWHVSWLAKRNAANEVEYQWGWNGSALKVSLANGGSSCCTDYTYSPSPGFTTGVWYNIAVTVNSTTNKLRWYQDGVFKRETDITGHGFGTDTDANLTLGSSFNGSGEFLNGNLDETRIYNRVLSDSEIEGLASGGSGPDVPTETPTPTNTPTPTSTPTPLSSSNNSSNSSSDNSSSCSDQPPSSHPDLYQVSTSITSATLYFTPVNPATGYIISYGTTPEANQYSVAFDYTNGTGAVSYTVNDLSQGTKYYFKVQTKNGCSTGSWSQIVSQMTTNGTEAPSNSTVSPKGTIEITHKEQTSKTKPEPRHNEESESSTDEKQDGYDLLIKVINNGRPVEGAIVEVHSTPRRATTDNNGIARFSNIEKGDHTVYLSYEGYQGEESLIVDGEEREIDVSFTIELKPNNMFFSPAAVVIIILLCIAVFVLLFVLWKRKSKE